MKATEDFKRLKKFLESRHSNKAWLALNLGYKSTLTIDKWIEKKRIPRLRRESVIELISSLVSENA